MSSPNVYSECRPPGIGRTAQSLTQAADEYLGESLCLVMALREQGIGDVDGFGAFRADASSPPDSMLRSRAQISHYVASLSGPLWERARSKMLRANRCVTLDLRQ